MAIVLLDHGFSGYNHAGTVDVIADFAGYFSANAP